MHQDDPLDLYNVNSSRVNTKDRVMIQVTINGVEVDMEVDTGAKASVIGLDLYEKHFSHVLLKPTRDLVWGGPLKMKGKFDAKIVYENQSANLTVWLTTDFQHYSVFPG